MCLKQSVLATKEIVMNGGFQTGKQLTRNLAAHQIFVNVVLFCSHSGCDSGIVYSRPIIAKQNRSPT